MTRLRCGVMLDVFVDKLLEMILVGEPDDRLHDFPTLEDENGRNAADAELRRSIRVLVYVELAHRDFAVVIGRQRVDRRREAPAWSAPLSPEVDEHRLVGLHDRLIEITVGKNLNLF